MPVPLKKQEKWTTLLIVPSTPVVAPNPHKMRLIWWVFAWLLLFHVVVAQDILTTIAGSGATASAGSFSGDGGSATLATLWSPYGIALDSAGNIYIADYSDQHIRKITIATGIISSIAGSSTSGSYSGDGGAATSASLYNPCDVALDASGNKFTKLLHLV